MFLIAHNRGRPVRISANFGGEDVFRNDLICLLGVWRENFSIVVCLAEEDEKNKEDSVEGARVRNYSNRRVLNSNASEFDGVCDAFGKSLRVR